MFSRSDLRIQVKMLAVSAVGLCLTGAMCACGGGRNPDREAQRQLPAQQKIGAAAVDILEGNDSLRFVHGVAAGTGSLLFADPLESRSEGYNYELALQLLANGSVELVAFAGNQLSSGFSVRFERDGDKGIGGLKVILSAAGRSYDISDVCAAAPAAAGGSCFKDLDAGSPQVFSIDLHNDEDPAHVVIWAGTREQAASGTLVPLFDSEESDAVPSTEERESSPGQGQGV
jgi:hypothetical protein